MAFPASGIHVSCHLVGGSDSSGRSTIALLGPCLWSETLSSVGNTTNVAPDSQNTVFVIRAFGDAWVGIDATPSPASATAKRRPMSAGNDHTQLARAGEKVGWTAA